MTEAAPLLGVVIGFLIVIIAHEMSRRKKPVVPYACPTCGDSASLSAVDIKGRPRDSYLLCGTCGRRDPMAGAA